MAQCHYLDFFGFPLVLRAARGAFAINFTFSLHNASCLSSLRNLFVLLRRSKNFLEEHINGHRSSADPICPPTFSLLVALVLLAFIVGSIALRRGSRHALG